MTNTTHYALEARVLACDHCGAPLDAGAIVGRLVCGFCSAANQIAPRPAMQTFVPPAATALSEPERLSRLEAQLQNAPVTPPGLAPLLEDGKIPPWRMQDAFATWRSLRKRAEMSDHAAAEELVFLTLLLARTLDSEPARQRALLESTVEVLSFPRHRQVVLCALVRGAAREADVAGAEGWLSRCDPSLDDLAADSAYRVARGLVATLRNRYDEVVSVLGDEKPVPLALEWRPLGALLRANAALAKDDKQGVQRALLSVEAGAPLDQEVARYPAVFSPALLQRAYREHRRLEGCIVVACTILAIPLWVAVVNLNESAKGSFWMALLLIVVGGLAAVATFCAAIMLGTLIFSKRAPGS